MISRRKFLRAGLAATAGVAGIAAADRLAHRYGLIPPDGGGIYGPGETLNYAAQRLFATHAPAREFPRSMISKTPFANEVAPPNEAFKKLQAGGFADWKLTVDGMVARPTEFSLADLKHFPVQQPDYRSGVRGRLVLHCGVDWDTAERSAAGGWSAAAGAVYCLFLTVPGLVGQSRYGRGAASADVVDDGDE